ncbi:hypothetical protein BCR33DRAFT_789896 [Rhizoclosmatium globosum]|uniref:Glutamate/phenylalanine/leucine/valine/L-tryptophan dehydrogenase dimerisation domain-containing protein n=1 Tax=Rhizoclosmatium globosum TaxID=329046 RepID=A0A1Y2BQL5_9FUNG|nr:hypothetical protein BCR33DRAFT_789896 [Rhizoclosmatium globosum]|eukprot:ORY37024.1 hypothetical protein BCR33DRAFT_789896 [Rhizoclosmatium globosum]
MKSRRAPVRGRLLPERKQGLRQPRRTLCSDWAGEWTLQSAVIHRTCRGAGAGGVRNWVYDDTEAFLRDGLRLSKAMTLKTGLAGLWWGGGKGCVARNSGKGLAESDSPLERSRVFTDYGSFLSRLSGVFVAAQDVGITEKDILDLHSATRFVTVSLLRWGVLQCLRFQLREVLLSPWKQLVITLESTYWCQDRDSGIGVPTIQSQFAKYGDRFELTIANDKGDNSILFEDVDIVSPCATGGILNDLTIPCIRAKIVCGAANNQLLESLIYASKFVCNRMGIVACADEHLGTIENDPRLLIHLGRDWNNSIYNLTRKVLVESETKRRTTQEISLEIAETESKKVNPLYGHRGIQIINSLTKAPTCL